MKKIFGFACCWLAIAICSCNKETIVDTPEQVGISKVAYYPSIQINGPTFVAVTEGAWIYRSGSRCHTEWRYDNIHYQYDDYGYYCARCV